jgi:hypothetical protein
MNHVQRLAMNRFRFRCDLDHDTLRAEAAGKGIPDIECPACGQTLIRAGGGVYRTRVDGDGFIPIPDAALAEAGWASDEKVHIEIAGDTIIVTKGQ